jgi:hypothetical protein
VVTTDFFASLGAHCERLGLPHDSFRNLVTVDPVGRELYHQCDSLHPLQLKRRCSQGRWGGS